MMMVKKVERQIAGRTLSIETGKLAKQAAGAVVVHYGDTVVLGTVVWGKPREGMDFFPLFVDYREKTSAAGKFPGGFIKREGRPTTKEILTMRMIDRPIRPLFPKGFRNEVQIQTMVWSADLENDPDLLAMIAASAALSISELPFDGPIGAVRVGRVDDEFVINPSHSELEESSMEMVLGGNKNEVTMIEVKAGELSEDIIADGVEFGHKTVAEICEMISELASDCGKEKMQYESPDTTELVGLMENKIGQEYREARKIDGKQEQSAKVEELLDSIKEEFIPANGQEGQYTVELVRMAIDDFQEKVMRSQILDDGFRSGGRGMEEIRQLSGEVGVLPRTHGSAVFTRGETQAMMTVTLGSSGDKQVVDGLLKEEFHQKFMLHYNFPPFCVGECGRIMGPGRREIGHGALAEKSLSVVVPDVESFPYTIRLVSDILESNGSSSMASVCAGTLAMMDAGIPIRHPVAGISIGMIKSGDRYVLLTDILGKEDHFGDMDFKVAGTQKGITGIQLDLKMKGLPFNIIREALERARTARLEILQAMLSVINEPRDKMSPYAPQIISVEIPVDLIGKVIGPGGRDIKALQERTGTTIDIENDGTIYISTAGGEGDAYAAKEIIDLMTNPPKIGKIYHAKIVAVKDFGVFAEIAPGQEGMCHISELADHYVESVSDECKVGDEMDFKVIQIDAQGRVKLSRKAAILDEKDD